MPNNSENYLSKVPESNSARQKLDILQNPWRNAQLMQVNKEERERDTKGEKLQRNTGRLVASIKKPKTR